MHVKKTHIYTTYQLFFVYSFYFNTIKNHTHTHVLTINKFI